jgi:uncharacterized cupin superfamily protein
VPNLFDPEWDAERDARELAPGEVVAFPAGRAGAHRLDDRTTEPVRVLVVSTMRAPEIKRDARAGRLCAGDRPARRRARRLD